MQQTSRISFSRIIGANLLLCSVLFGQVPQGIRTEVNLGPFPFDYYISGASLPSCPGITIQTCMQAAFQNWSHNQNVSGVRFQFGLCGDVHSTPLSPCDFFNPSIPAVNADWHTNVEAFMKDLQTAGIFNITPTPSFLTAVLPRGDPSFDGCVYPPPQRPDATYSFVPTLPFVIVSSNGYPPNQGLNNAYNCSTRNGSNFVGWNNIYMAIDDLLGAAQGHGIMVTELDLQNEVNIRDFTVEARLLYDNCGFRAKVSAIPG